MQSPSTSKPPYYPTLDGLRFLCAAWVVLSHFFPSYYALPDNFAVNGYWAVAIFFVISGLCIHAPYVTHINLDIPKFYKARFIRIIPPIAIAIPISTEILHNFPLLLGILWSLYCEIIYYALYPIILLILRKYSHIKIILASYYAFILMTIIRDWLGPNPYETFILAPLFGLPLWLLGCLLAEALIKKDGRLQYLENFKVLIGLRVLIIVIGLLLGLSDLFKQVSSILTMCLLGPVIFYWLYSELTQVAYSKLLLHLAKFGKGSYSLYLTHSLAIPLAVYSGLLAAAHVNWFLYIVAVTVFTTMFYFVIEKPSHQLSKKLGK